MSIRIATVRATGDRYIVQRLTIPTTGPALVHCWGEVMRYTGLKTQHGVSRTFTAAEVDVVDAAKTPALLASLFDQAVRAAKAAGATVVATGKRHVTLDRVPRI